MKPEAQWTCEEVRADLPLFVGGDLFEDEHQQPSVEALRLHLSGCSKCAEEFAALTRSREAFLRLGENCGAPGLWPDVRAVLAAEGRFAGAAAPAPVRRYRMALAVALFLGLGVFVWLEFGEGGVSPAPLEPAALALEGEPADEVPSLASPLRPLLAHELALSEGAEIFGVSEGVGALLPSHTTGGASAAGLTKIR